MCEKDNPATGSSPVTGQRGYHQRDGADFLSRIILPNRVFCQVPEPTSRPRRLVPCPARMGTEGLTVMRKSEPLSDDWWRGLHRVDLAIVLAAGRDEDLLKSRMEEYRVELIRSAGKKLLRLFGSALLRGMKP